MKLSTLVDIARDYKNICLLGHIHPDGDCVGATIGLAMLLEKYHITSTVLLKDLPNQYDFLPITRYVSDHMDEPVDLIISLDASDPERLGSFEQLLTLGKKVINIDHHMSNTMFGDYNYVDVEASSTSEMVFQMVEDFSVMDINIAKALYTGILFDTGGFKHSNTKPSTHLAAAKLISYGFDFSELIHKLFDMKPLKAFKAQGLAFERARTYMNEKILVCYLNMEDYSNFGIEKSDTESIVHYMNNVEGVEVAVFFYAIDADTYKISLRSKGSVDVCKVAMDFGGGGHQKASGASIKAPLEDAILVVTNAISLQL
jgi:phosphoesterase RecJ-like protein